MRQVRLVEKLTTEARARVVVKNKAMQAVFDEAPTQKTGGE